MKRFKIDPALAIGLGLAAVAIAALGPFVVAHLGQVNRPPDASREVVYTIPPGTAQLIEAGGDPKIVPAEMVFTLGVQDVLVVHNQDETGHTFGPYWVAARQTLRVQFSNPAEYEGYCSVHPSRQVRIIARRP